MNRVYLTSGILLAISIITIIIGIVLRTSLGFWIIIIVGGLGIIGTIIYFLYSARRVLTGAIEQVILDVTGIKAIRKNEVIRQMSWEEIDTFEFEISEVLEEGTEERFTLTYLDEIDFKSELYYISRIYIIPKNEEQKVFPIHLANYATQQFNSLMMSREFEDAFLFFKKKHQEKTKSIS